jgi:hypothetical protein
MHSGVEGGGRLENLIFQIVKCTTFVFSYVLLDYVDNRQLNS